MNCAHFNPLHFPSGQTFDMSVVWIRAKLQTVLIQFGNIHCPEGFQTQLNQPDTNRWHILNGLWITVKRYFHNKNCLDSGNMRKPSTPAFNRPSWTGLRRWMTQRRKQTKPPLPPILPLFALHPVVLQTTTDTSMLPQRSFREAGAHRTPGWVPSPLFQKHTPTVFWAQFFLLTKRRDQNKI